MATTNGSGFANNSCNIQLIQAKMTVAHSLYLHLFEDSNQGDVRKIKKNKFSNKE